MQLPERVGQVLHFDLVDMLQRARRRFCQHARFLRAVTRRGDQRAGAEGDRRAQDGSDIVRVRHLVEHQHQPRIPNRVQTLRLERLGLDQHALMHGIRPCDPVDVLRLDQLGLEGQGCQVGDRKPLGGVACHQHLSDLAPRVVERRTHRMQAVKPHQTVGGAFAWRHRLARPECGRAARLLVAMRAPQLGVVGVLGRARLVAFVVAHAGLYSRPASLRIPAVARNAGHPRKTLPTRLTPTGLAAIRRIADFGDIPTRAPGQRECLVAWLRRQTGEVPEWLKGTDCKSVGLAYVGSNPTLSTTAGLEALKRKASEVFSCFPDASAGGYSSVVEQQPSKLNMRVRFPLPAPDFHRHCRSHENAAHGGAQRIGFLICALSC
ncbi:hypothetical protein MPLB_1090003 [Mesorhizobium sp. ORS 3324]|nr:hypothetical protein MPLB_1090003 [Mesorhizobium sp. ORS 3324]